MIPSLYWIDGPWPGRLAVSSRPRGGDWLEDDVRGWREAGISVVVSLLERSEEVDLAIENESALATEAGLRFYSFPVPDRGVPFSAESTCRLLTPLIKALEHGANVAIHCRQGLGRSPLIACALLIKAGADAASAIAKVSASRGVPVPETLEQRNWIERQAPEPVGSRR